MGIPGQYCSVCDGKRFVPFIPRWGQSIGCPKCNGSTRELLPCPCGCGALKRSPFGPTEFAGPKYLQDAKWDVLSHDEKARRIAAAQSHLDEVMQWVQPT